MHRLSLLGTICRCLFGIEIFHIVESAQVIRHKFQIDGRQSYRFNPWQMFQAVSQANFLKAQERTVPPPEGGQLRIVLITSVRETWKFSIRIFRFSSSRIPCAGNKFLWAGSFTLVYRFRSPSADDCFLLRGIDFPLRSILSHGVNAVVLENGTLYYTGSTGHTCFCKTKLYGRKHGRYTPGIYHAVGTDCGILRAGCMGI